MNITPIRNENDNNKALARIDELWGAKVSTPEGDELDILLILVERFESQNYVVGTPDPIEAIRFRMDQDNLKPADLVDVLGQRSRVTEILNKKRKLTLNMIRGLNKKLAIPLKVLVQDYNLA